MTHFSTRQTLQPNSGWFVSVPLSDALGRSYNQYLKHFVVFLSLAHPVYHLRHFRLIARPHQPCQRLLHWPTGSRTDSPSTVYLSASCVNRMCCLLSYLQRSKGILFKPFHTSLYLSLCHFVSNSCSISLPFYLSLYISPFLFSLCVTNSLFIK